MSATNNKSKYYRIMNSPTEDWQPYRYEPMYDEYPSLATFKSTYGIGTPGEGDYIIEGPGGALHIERPTDFERFADVSFDAMPSLVDLRSIGMVIAAPDDIRKLDYELQQKHTALSEELYYAESGMQDLADDMSQKKFGFPTRAARAARKEYDKRKPEVEQLQRQYDELKTELQERVIGPLQEILSKQEFAIGGHICRQFDEWQINNTTYILGRTTEGVDFYHARATEDGKAYEYEFDALPTRKEVESCHVDFMSERDIDRHEAEYGADGSRTFPHRNDEPQTVKTNMGEIPVTDYREIVAHQHGFDSYEEMYNEGIRIGNGYDKAPEASGESRTQAAIESTNDYSNTTFHQELIDTEIQNEDGSCGKVVDYFRIAVVGEDGRITALDERVFTSAEEAQAAVKDDPALKLISYDQLVHEAGTRLGFEPQSTQEDPEAIRQAAEDLMSQGSYSHEAELVCPGD